MGNHGWKFRNNPSGIAVIFLLLTFTPVSFTQGFFDTREECDSVLGDWKRINNSKYLYPADWNKWNDVTAISGKNSAKAICDQYGLSMPSAYDMRDWLSIQEIGRDYAANTAKPSTYPFFLSDQTKNGKIIDADGNSVETFILWDTFEPSGDGQHVSIKLVKDTRDGLYYATANDMPSVDPPRPDHNTGGKVVCMYPMFSFCFSDSSEYEETEGDEGLMKEPYFLGRVEDSFYLWVSFTPKFIKSKERLDEECRQPKGGKPPSVEWLGDFSTVDSTAPDFKVAMDKLEAKLASLQLHPPLIFGTFNSKETAYWVPLYGMRSRTLKLDIPVPYFFMCIYRFPTETCG